MNIIKLVGVRILTSLLLVWSIGIQAGPSYDAGANIQKMSQILNGPALTVSNLSVSHGVTQQYGIFSGANETFGIDHGIFMTTGNLGSLQGPNNDASYSYNTLRQHLDSDLATISNNAKYDPVIIEFDVRPRGDRLNFVFAFGSEEYPEYVCSPFNDAFGMFVSGPGFDGVRNAAFMPNSQDAIAVNNVNVGSPGSKADGTSCNLNNAAYFINNGNGHGSPSSQMDGYTKAITTSLDDLHPDQTYHVKLALADAGDYSYDSAAMFKWLTSTKTEPVDLELVASVDNAMPVKGSEVEITYTVRNTSNRDTAIVLVGLEWPAGLTWLSDNSNGAFNPSTAEWYADVVLANSEKHLKIRARAGSDNHYRIDGEIYFAFNEDPDSTPFNRSIRPDEDDSASVTINPQNQPTPTEPDNQPPQIISNGGNDFAYIPLQEENGVAVTTVMATDPDNDIISYSLSGEDAAVFSINSKIGVVQFLVEPDYENPQDQGKDNFYNITVIASDGQQQDTQKLSMGVANVQENTAPVIISNGGGSSTVINITEGNTEVTEVEAEDSEKDDIDYEILGGPDAALFKISRSSGRLRFINAPDYQNPQDQNTDNVYEVDVTATDGKLSDSQKIYVSVVNNTANNQPPVITNPSTLTIDENGPLHVADLSAQDSDDQEGNGLIYSLTGQPDDDLFTLNSITGVLSLTTILDFEQPRDANQDNIYLVGVKVCDSANACAERIMEIRVRDIDEDNDHDGMMDSQERAIGTNPFDADSDDDGIKDLEEVVNPHDPVDSDGDGSIDALDADDDNDTILTRYEITDPNQDGHYADSQDTDGDGKRNHLDNDDDGDSVLTRYEEPDPNNDGNPVDARDTDNDTLPDYLDNNDDNDSELTTEEEPDPNGDGNPDDARDDNNNGVPSWLDPTEDLTVSIRLKLILQGPYNSTEGLMGNKLWQSGAVPRLQPYGELKTAFGYVDASDTVSPFSYFGTETASLAVWNASGNNAPVDWLLIELRDKNDPSQRAGAMAALLQRDGDVVDAVTGSNTLRILNMIDGDYYVVVRHRNHLGIMTATPVPLQTPPYELDFTQVVTPVYGDHARLEVGSLALMWAGDTNNSNSAIVNGPGSDSNVILGSILVAPENALVNTSFRLKGYYSTDLNMDGVVTFTGPANDTNLLLGNVLLHPSNVTLSTNFILPGTVPR